MHVQWSLRLLCFAYPRRFSGCRSFPSPGRRFGCQYSGVLLSASFPLLSASFLLFVVASFSWFALAPSRLVLCWGGLVNKLKSFQVCASMCALLHVSFSRMWILPSMNWICVPHVSLNVVVLFPSNTKLPASGHQIMPNLSEFPGYLCTHIANSDHMSGKSMGCSSQKLAGNLVALLSHLLLETWESSWTFTETLKSSMKLSFLHQLRQSGFDSMSKQYV